MRYWRCSFLLMHANSELNLPVSQSAGRPCWADAVVVSIWNYLYPTGAGASCFADAVVVSIWNYLYPTGAGVSCFADAVVASIWNYLYPRVLDVLAELMLSSSIRMSPLMTFLVSFRPWRTPLLKAFKTFSSGQKKFSVTVQFSAQKLCCDFLRRLQGSQNHA